MIRPQHELTYEDTRLRLHARLDFAVQLLARDWLIDPGRYVSIGVEVCLFIIWRSIPLSYYRFNRYSVAAIL